MFSFLVVTVVAMVVVVVVRVYNVCACHHLECICGIGGAN